MPRYAAEVSYDGARFYGWQRQPGLPTVQESLEKALSLLNGAQVKIEGAGRTDAGVHARAQVCSFDMEKEWRADRLTLAVNANLDSGVSVMRAVRARDDFHARFDAASREYIYFIWNARTVYPMTAPYSLWLKSANYDWNRAAAASSVFVGEHDFGAFCRAADRPEDTVRTIYSARLIKRGNLIWLRVKGSGFLTNMVRIMAGSLEKVAKGEKDAEWIKELLRGGSARTSLGKTLPPHGLFLWKINYAPSPWSRGGVSI